MGVTATPCPKAPFARRPPPGLDVRIGARTGCPRPRRRRRYRSSARSRACATCRTASSTPVWSTSRVPVPPWPRRRCGGRRPLRSRTLNPAHALVIRVVDLGLAMVQTQRPDVLDTRRARDRAGLERGSGGHHLEHRPGLVDIRHDRVDEALGRLLRDRLVVVGVVRRVRPLGIHLARIGVHSRSPTRSSPCPRSRPRAAPAPARAGGWHPPSAARPRRSCPARRPTSRASAAR